MALDRIEKQVEAQLALAKAATSPGTAAPYLNKALYTLTALHTQYGSHAFVQKVLDEVLAVVSSSGAALSDFQKTQFEKVKSQVEPLLAQVDASSTSSPATAVRLLSDVNKLLLPARKTMQVDAGVRALINRVDRLNLAIFSRIPLEEEFIPLLDVNVKSPRAYQDAVRSLNEVSKKVNTAVGAGKKLFEAIASDGSNLQFTYEGYPDLWETIGAHFSDAKNNYRVIREKFLPACVAGRGDWADNGPSMVEEAIEALDKEIASWSQSMPLRTRYAQQMAYAKHLCLASASGINRYVSNLSEKERDEKLVGSEDFNLSGMAAGHIRLTGGLSPRDRYSPPRANVLALQFLDDAHMYANKAKEILPDDHAEADQTIAEANAIAAQISQQHATMCLERIEHWTKVWEEQPYNWERQAKDWKKDLILLPSGREKESEAEKLIAEVEKMREEKAERIREEQRKAAEAKEAKRREDLAKLKAKLLDGHTEGGSVKTPDGKISFSPSAPVSLRRSPVGFPQRWYALLQSRRKVRGNGWTHW